MSLGNATGLSTELLFSLATLPGSDGDKTLLLLGSVFASSCIARFFDGNGGGDSSISLRVSEVDLGTSFVTKSLAQSMKEYVDEMVTSSVTVRIWSVLVRIDTIS